MNAPHFETRPVAALATRHHGSTLALVRRCGMAAAAFDSVAVRALTGSVKNATVAEADAAQAGRSFADHLYDVVPSLDAADRRVALAIRRTVHRGAVPESDLPDGIPDFVRQSFRRYLSARAAANRAWEAARQCASEGSDAAAVCLEKLARTLVIESALALTNPQTYRELRGARSGKDFAPGTRLGRTLIGLVGRATVKTSPMGMLTVVVGDLDVFRRTGTETPGDHPLVVSIQLARALCRELLAGLAARELADVSLVLPATTLAFEHRLWMQVPRYTTDSGFFWRQDTSADVTTEVNVLATVQQGRAVDGHLARNAFDSFDEPRFVRNWLLATNTVAPLAPWEPSSDTELAALAGVVAGEAGRVLLDVQASIGTLATASPEARESTASLVLQSLSDLASALGRPLSNAFDASSILKEDVAVRSTLSGAWPSSLTGVKSELQTLVIESAVREPFYDLLLQAFRAMRVRCMPFAEFALRFSRQPDVRAALASIASENSPAQRFVDLPEQSQPLLAAAYLQPLAGGAVLNDLTLNAVGAVARFAPLFEDGTDAVAEFARQAFEGQDGLIHELVVAADTTGLQSRGVTGKFPLLVGATEGRWRDVPSLSLEQCILGLDEERDELILTDPNGRRILPFYSGLIPTSLVFGPTRIALTIAMPWRLRPTGFSMRMPQIGRPEPLEGPVHRPRVHLGPLVTSRERWSFPTALLAEVAGRTGADQLVAMERWRQANGLPATVFARIESANYSLSGSGHKPMPLDFRSPHMVEAFLSRSRGSVNATFDEALPALDSWESGFVDEHLVVSSYGAPS